MITPRSLQPIAIPRSVLTFALLVAPTLRADDLPPSLEFREGPVNAVAIVRDGHRLAVNRSGEPAERLLLTHGRRDVVAYARESRAETVAAPAASKTFLEGAGAFWNEWWEKRFDYYGQQVTRRPVRNFPASRYLEDGDTIEWRDLVIRHLATPGYTRDAGTYLAEIDGDTVAFTGDLVLAGGKVPDLYSFQDAIPAAKVGAYHGHLGRLAQWLDSLERLAAAEPDLLVPSRGPVSHRPAEDLAAAAEKARAIYRNYLSTNALHWYFGEERMNTCAERVLGPDHGVTGMPFAEHVDLPEWCRHIGTTKLLVSESGRGFVLDVGRTRALDTLKQAVADGLVDGIDGIFATHTHNDHTAAIADAAAAFACPVYAVPRVADVLAHPGRWFLPGVSPNDLGKVEATPDGHRMEWEEFTFTFRFFPGQMYNHGALLVERPGHEPVFFIGDSFSPSGIDDYCLMNRNLMREDTGYARCFRILDSLPEKTWLVNQHIPHLFRFTGAERSFLVARYEARAERIAEFVPQDDLNYAIDEQWAWFYPYGRTASPGETVTAEVRLWNHSTVPRTFAVEPETRSLEVATPPEPVSLEARATGPASFEIAVPSDAEPGIHVVTATVRRDDGFVARSRCECLVRVEAP